MNVDMKYRPAFTTLFVTLAPGETIIAESDAMASMSSSIGIRTRFNGGFFAAIFRKIFGGESLFINEFAAEGSPGEVVLTQPCPGDIERIDLKGQSLFLQPGAFIACESTVNLSLGWAGFASWFGGEGLFRLKVSGQGAVWFGGYGSVVAKEVDGEYRIDTSHVLAYEPTLGIKVALSGGIFSSFFGGEGFVSRVRGKGRVYMQTRSMDGLAAWTNTYLW